MTPDEATLARVNRQSEWLKRRRPVSRQEAVQVHTTTRDRIRKQRGPSKAAQKAFRYDRLPRQLTDEAPELVLVDEQGVLLEVGDEGTASNWFKIGA